MKNLEEITKNSFGGDWLPIKAAITPSKQRSPMEMRLCCLYDFSVQLIRHKFFFGTFQILVAQRISETTVSLHKPVQRIIKKVPKKLYF